MPTLDWIGKKAVVNHHKEVPFRLLKCDPDLSVGDPESGNLLVQGDNLLALKALLPYYAGQVKCIYIDPPYNTGNEKWVYNDNVNSPEIREWLGSVVGKEGDDLCRHDKWLCMMYPRLILLREFLSHNGVIFISIGKHEVGHLRLLCDEIFGRNNHVETLIWETEGHTENQEEITGVHEYALVYSKQPNTFRARNIVDPNVPEDSKIRRDFAENSITKNGFKNPASIITLPIGFPCVSDNITLHRFEKIDEFMGEVRKIGGYIIRELTKKYKAKYPLLVDDLIVKNNKLERECRVFSGWMSANKLKKFIDNNCNAIDDDGTSLSFFLSAKGVVYYLRKGRESKYIKSVVRNVGTTEKNKYELEAMGIDFPYPKPKEYIAYLLSLVTGEDDIILDSFMGSGTTGHAVYLLNNEDGRKRKYIGIEIDQNICSTITQKRLASVVSSFATVAQDVDKSLTSHGLGFNFCTLGEALFDSTGQIAKTVSFIDLARFVFFKETGLPLPDEVSGKSPLIGTHNGTGVYLLYNGVLGDKTPQRGNALTRAVLADLPPYDGPKVAYGTSCRVGLARLKQENMIFRQIPYELKVD